MGDFDEYRLERRVVKDVEVKHNVAEKNATLRKKIDKNSGQDDDAAPSPVQAQEAMELTFQDLWKDGNAEKLHSVALSHDLKKETLQDDEEELEDGEKLTVSSWEKDLKDMTLFNSGRLEKTRRGHLSKAAKGFEAASQELAKIQAERNAIILARQNPKSFDQNKEMTEKLMELIPESEKMIGMIFDAEIETVKARGKRDKAEKLEIEEIKQQKRRALRNLYRQEMHVVGFLPTYKEILMQKALKLEGNSDATSARLALASEELSESFKEYTELTEEEIFEEAKKNPYNTERRLVSDVWGSFDHVKFKGKRGFGTGYYHGYVCTGNSFLMNHYLRVLYAEQLAAEQWKAANDRRDEYLAGLEDQRQEALAKAKDDQEKSKIEQKVAKYKAEIMDRAKKDLEMADLLQKESEADLRALLNEFQKRFGGSGQELIDRFKKWEKKVQLVVDEMDLATGRYVLTDEKTGKVIEQCNRLSHKAKFYRMLGNDILDWGFGLTDQEKQLSQAEIVELLNRKAGIGFMDKGYMSVGWSVDQGFANRPIMLTMLTEKGKKCFVTKNFKEGEVVFGRRTKYMLVCAINHSEEAQTLKRSVTVPDSAQSAKDLIMPRVIMDELGDGSCIDFKGIELVVRVLPDEDEIELSEEAKKEVQFKYMEGGLQIEGAAEDLYEEE